MFVYSHDATLFMVEKSCAKYKKVNPSHHQKLWEYTLRHIMYIQCVSFVQEKGM